MKLGVFKRVAKEFPPERPTLENPARVEDYLKTIKQLPSLSETVMRAMAIANDDNYRFGDLIDVIKRDGAITALLLKIANSVIYGSSKVSGTVDKAVIKIGMIQCNRIIMTVGMKGALKPNNPDVVNRVNILWRHSLLTAYVTGYLNKQLELGFKGEDYTAALLHDIGRVVMLLADDKTSKRIDPLTFREPSDILEWERDAIGTDHCELGMEYALRQNLPESICQVIRYHHIPLGANMEHRLLTDLVAAADHLTNHVLSERKVSNYDHTTSPSFQRLLARKSADYVERFPRIIAAVIKAATKDTREALRVAEESEMARA